MRTLSGGTRLAIHGWDEAAGLLACIRWLQANIEIHGQFNDAEQFATDPTNRDVSCKICSAEKPIVNQNYLTDCSQIALLEVYDPQSNHLRLQCGTNHHQNEHYPQTGIYMPGMTREHFFLATHCFYDTCIDLFKSFSLIRRAECTEGSYTIQYILAKNCNTFGPNLERLNSKVKMKEILLHRI